LNWLIHNEKRSIFGEFDHIKVLNKTKIKDLGKNIQIPHPKKIFRNSSAAEDVVTEEYFEKFFCCTKISFARARIHSLQINIFAPRRISSSVGDIFSACEDFIKISEFYRRHIFCARRNIFCARRKSHPKEDIHPLQKINHLHQKNKFICNRKYSSVTTSSAAEDSFFGCRERVCQVK
jgi:hypothetical protein